MIWILCCWMCLWMLNSIEYCYPALEFMRDLRLKLRRIGNRCWCLSWNLTASRYRRRLSLQLWWRRSWKRRLRRTRWTIETATCWKCCCLWKLSWNLLFDRRGCYFGPAKNRSSQKRSCFGLPFRQRCAEVFQQSFPNSWNSMTRTRGSNKSSSSASKTCRSQRTVRCWRSRSELHTSSKSEPSSIKIIQL